APARCGRPALAALDGRRRHRARAGGALDAALCGRGTTAVSVSVSVGSAGPRGRTPRGLRAALRAPTTVRFSRRGASAEAAAEAAAGVAAAVPLPPPGRSTSPP